MIRLRKKVQRFFRFAHRAFAAREALRRRCSEVIVTRQSFPPILPPRRPMAAITREISSWEIAGVAITVSEFSSALSAPIRLSGGFTSLRGGEWKSAWNSPLASQDQTSPLLLIRFC